MEKFINRELSWLEFNQRVLDEARDETVPLLERVKFLAITGSNLDEFFMVRAGGLQLLVEAGITKSDPSGMSPKRQLSAVRDRARRMVHEQYACLLEELEPALAESGIRRVRPDGLSENQMKHLEWVFENELSAILTPMAIDAEKPFPLLMNLRIYIAFRLRSQEKGIRHRFAVLPIGAGMDRFITLPSQGQYQYILLEDVLRIFQARLFPGQAVQESACFRVTRNADMSVREEGAPDLLAQMEKVLDQRKESGCVRLEAESDCSRIMLSFLKKSLSVAEPQIFHIPSPLNLKDLFKIASVNGYEELKNPSWVPQPKVDLEEKEGIFNILSKNDILLNHPYDSYEPVVKLIEDASRDPDVLAIKQILYRTSKNSPIIAALERAAAEGKNVTVIVELKARFDEAQNIEWAKRLEQAGAQIIYGIKGLKTHAKVCIIVRREPQGIVRYIHFGTGNYNEATARLYSDISYMTSNEKLGADAATFFNSISGYSQPQRFLGLEMAPLGIRDRLLTEMDREIERKRQGQKALIMAKMNSLVDPKLIRKMYKASQAGVKIMLNIRGICCLVPGVRGLSENIQVVSIVDRFLEHSRIYFFQHGKERDIFISSADWMPRNLDKRIELLVSVTDLKSKNQLIEILKTYFKDTAKSHVLLPDKTWQRQLPKGKKKKFRSQEYFYKQAGNRIRQGKQQKKTTFEPYRPPAE